MLYKYLHNIHAHLQGRREGGGERGKKQTFAKISYAYVYVISNIYKWISSGKQGNKVFKGKEGNI